MFKNLWVPCAALAMAITSIGSLHAIDSTIYLEPGSVELQSAGPLAFTDDGVLLGVVSQIIPSGNTEIYVVKSGQGEILLPGTREVVKHIDLENGKMMISALEGLLDLNEV